MRGLGRQMPITMAAFFIASLSIIGVPPTGGTWSKWFLLLGTLEAEQWVLMIVLLMSSLLNIAYLLPISVNAFFPNFLSGKEPGGERLLAKTQIKEAPLPSLIALCITALACVILFIYPQHLYQLSASILDISGMLYGK